MPTSSAPSPPSPKRRRRWVGYTLLGLIVVVGLVVVRVAWKINATPTYWQERDAYVAQTPPQEIDRLAHDIQSRTLREWSYPIGDGDGVRTVRYNFDEINAWLATRLRPLLANQSLELPEEVGEFMVAEREGDLVLAFDYTSSRFGPRIASLYFDFRAEDAEIATRLKTARAGNQRLAIRYLVDAIAEQPSLRDPEVQRIFEQLSKRSWINLPPIPVDDHRDATLLDIEILPEGVDLLIRVAYKNRD